MSASFVRLSEITSALESGGRPKRGASDVVSGVLSLGGEHVLSDGSLNLSQKRLVPFHYYDAMRRGRLKRGDILVVKDGATTGKVGFVDSSIPLPATVNEHVFRLEVREKVADQRYVFFHLLSPTGNRQILQDFRGATVGGISQDFIECVELPLPSLPEQKRIVGHLEQAERLRRTRRYSLELSDGLAPSIFHEMFGDPASNPKSWPTCYLGDVLQHARDGPHVSPRYVKQGIPFLSTRNIRPGEILWEDLKYISQLDAEEQWKKVKPEAGDILYTKGGTTGMAKAVDFNREIAVWVHIAVLRVKRDLVCPVWLENMLNSPFCYRQSQELTFGIVNRDLGLKRMPRIRILLPPLSKQMEFAHIAQRNERLRARHQETLRLADHLFQFLLYRAFSHAKT